MQSTLLKTKLHVPTPRPRLVRRRRLCQRLEDAAQSGSVLTLVSARAGSGKTTLVSEWLQQMDRSTVWISLDAKDNDPHRFCHYLLAGLQRLDDSIGQSAQSWLESLQMPDVDLVLGPLVNEISDAETPVVLVLDDLHVIHHEWIHQALQFLIEHRPRDLRLILITRVDPPLPLARLRGQGQLAEIRDKDLRFTQEEASTFFAETMCLVVPEDALATLERRTEGWVAGLQMAAASLAGKDAGELRAFVATFRGTNRYVLDFLLEEILGSLEPDVRDFLFETSILERLCADLCDAVRSPRGGSGDSRDILDYLERANLFLIPVDEERCWYRYHHLFADQLRSSLRHQHTEDQIRALHRRASQWHRKHGSLEEAMTHAMSCRDYESASFLIEERFSSLFSRSEVPLLLEWIDALPQELVRQRPWLHIYRATTLVLSGKLDGVEELLANAEQCIEPDNMVRNGTEAGELLGHIASVRAYAANLRGDAEMAKRMATLAVEHLPAGPSEARGLAAHALADTLLAEDDMQGAELALEQMLAVGRSSGRLLVVVSALCELAALRKTQGRLHHALELYRKSYDWMAQKAGLDSRVRCAYEFGMADLMYEWNRLYEAYSHVQIGNSLRQRLGGYWITGDIPLIRILLRRGETEAALTVLRDVEEIVRTHHFQLASLAAFKAARVCVWLDVGDVQAAHRSASGGLGESEVEQIAQARLWMAQDRVPEAYALLQQHAARAKAGSRSGRLIEILCHLALASQRQSRLAEADAALGEAILLAWPERYVRVFLDLGGPMRSILSRLRQDSSALGVEGTEIRRLSEDYVNELLTAFRAETAAGYRARDDASRVLLDPLTVREIEVLRLLAQGLSNKQIAGQLIVAPSTVKQHLKNIYGKLDVHNRTQAVQRGRELSLL